MGRPTDDIVDQMSLFFRHLHALYQAIRPEGEDAALERPAQALLSTIAKRGPLRASALADVMHLDLSTISRQVAALETAGLVTREPDPADRRASLLRVSERGAAVFARNVERFRQLFAELLSDWTESERAEFARLFVRLNQTIADRCAPDGDGSNRCAPHRATTVGAAAPGGTVTMQEES